MQFLLDECLGGRRLRDALAAAGHDSLLSLDALGAGVDDAALLEFGYAHDRVVITANNADFVALTEETVRHAGVILIGQGDGSGELTTPDIVKAVTNVTKAHRDGIAGSTIVLDDYTV